MGAWLRGLFARRGKAKAIIALANKIGRVVWCVISTGCEYDVKLAFKPL
ncbi:transposase [Vibrio vulnificus]|nr:transposase [Vibrio vulnificus]